MKYRKSKEENSTAYERLIRVVYQFFACLRGLEYQLHAGMIFTTLFELQDKKFTQRFLKLV